MRRVGLLALAGLVVACSGPPIQERQQADEAIAAARAAGAATYAPDDLNAAETSLKAYEEAVAQRDFRLALSRALEARDHGYEAVKLATDQKKTLTARRDVLIADTKALVTTAQAHLTDNKSGHGADHLRQTIRSATEAMQEAGALSANGDVKGAVARIADAPDRLRKELAAFDAGLGSVLAHI